MLVLDCADVHPGHCAQRDRRHGDAALRCAALHCADATLHSQILHGGDGRPLLGQSALKLVVGQAPEGTEVTVL